MSALESRCSDNVVKAFCGTKVDKTRELVREVTTQEGETMAKDYNGAYFEVSAMDGTGVEEMFEEIIRYVFTFYGKTFLE